MQYTQYDVGQFYSWYNDAGIAGAYKPLTVGNRSDGLAQDFVNENIELVRKLSFVLQLSDPDDYEGGNLQLLDEGGATYFAPRKRGTVILFDSRTQHRVLPVKSDFVSLLLDGLLDRVGSEVNYGRRNDTGTTSVPRKTKHWYIMDSK